MYDYARTVYTLGSGVFEWQGWAVSEFVGNDDVDVTVQCLSAHTFYIDDVHLRPLTGDVYWRSQFVTSLRVTRGFHTIYVPLRAKTKHNFQCSITQRTPSKSFIVHTPHFLPQIWNQRLISGYVALPVTNLLVSKWLRVSKVSVLESSPGLSAKLLDKRVMIAPGQTLSVRVELKADQLFSDNCEEVPIELELTTNEGNDVIQLSLRCRKMSQSFLFTFVDHDASLQVAAAIKPRSTCAKHLCPVLLTLHGTGVDKQTQADSYKHMVNGEFVFGAEHAWVLAPTRFVFQSILTFEREHTNAREYLFVVLNCNFRHGAHNWEGPGALTALTALEQLVDVIKPLDWLADKPSSDHVILAG